MTETTAKPRYTIAEYPFKLPIMYSPNCKSLDPLIINELELTKINAANTDQETLKPVYDHIFSPQTSISKQILEKIAAYYTTDRKFLKESQQCIRNLSLERLETPKNNDLEQTIQTWSELKAETAFCEKYLFVDWDFAKSLNNNTTFLQCMSMYNITSPLLSLCLPIIILIIPFILLKCRGIAYNLAEYIKILKTIASSHALVKIFTNYSAVDTNQKIYLLVSTAFYLFSIYQNGLCCIRFYSNMKKIHSILFTMHNYLERTIEKLSYFQSICAPYSTYAPFCQDAETNKQILQQFAQEIRTISPLRFSLSKARNLGHIMKTFYQLFDSAIYHDAFLYSFHFNGYLELLTGIKRNFAANHIAAATFPLYSRKKSANSNAPRALKFRNMYYPPFMHSPNNIKNNISLKKNRIISGVNASGKTTILKTCFINVLLCQQVGFGCFDSLELPAPFDHFYTYLNIPDTSSRDSLFQAEARRCKMLIDKIRTTTNKKQKCETYFCIFDELYSGTNPEEAIASSCAFISYLAKQTNVSFLITTHYIPICEHFASHKRVENNCMEMRNGQGTFKIQKGISRKKGGIQVLKNMDYPKEIIDLL